MWHSVDQNSDEWFKLRIGKVTSSNFDKIMAHDCKKWGQGAIDYAERLALEIVTGERDETSSFKNSFMDRGHELEPFAIEDYEREHFKSVTNGGFFVSDCGRFGDSPDGLTSKGGCVEVKSVIPKTQWKRIKSGKMDSSYKWQVLGHLFIGKKAWCDFISYCPEMAEKHITKVFRVYRDEIEIGKLQNRLNEFHELVMEHVELLK